MRGDTLVDGRVVKRVCKSCGIVKRYDCFHVADKSGNRRGVCTSCINYSKSPDMWVKNCIRKKLHSRSKRACSKCGKIKLLTYFPNDYKGRVHNNKKSYCLACAYLMKESYVSRNKDRKAKWDNTYYEKNKESINKKSLEAMRGNPQIKIAHHLRCSVGKILKRRCQKKVGSVTESIGCSRQELVAHLEKQFQQNKETGEMMTWENYGYYGWHTDHIRPLCSFNLENLEDFRKASHYSNLQPLWAKENLSKGGSWI